MAWPGRLPTLKGYTVDVRLKQFRRVLPGPRLEFFDFDSKKGRKLIAESIAELDKKRRSASCDAHC